jgi:hypothetical protein
MNTEEKEKLLNHFCEYIHANQISFYYYPDNGHGELINNYLSLQPDSITNQTEDLIDPNNCPFRVNGFCTT